MKSYSFFRLGCWTSILLAFGAGLAAAQTAIDEEAPWPRVKSANGNTVTLHQPQVERWTSNSFSARAAVAVKLAGAKSELLGVVWFDAHGSVDRSSRIVTLNEFEITRGRFPDAKDNGSNALAAVREVVPAGARTISLDYLVTALGFERAAARQGSSGLKHTPPAIIWATNRSVLILIDGEPMLRPIPGSALQRVVNTPALLVRDPASDRFYLSGDGRWFSASAISGPWSLAQTPPSTVAALAPATTNAPSASPGEPPPRIIISTSPAELLMTADLPDFRPIRGTALQYAADSDSQLFYHTTDREAYLLLSGRWFKAPSLKGPWNYVAPHDLPADFARIPPGLPQGVVLASVPGTPQADLALLANSVPATATVKRREARVELAYDGEPKFKSIEGTPLSYAINADSPVIRVGEKYYALDNGVWFLAASPTGPWEVAAEVPEDIYAIPPSSPVYYATFARVYEANEEEVEVGCTPGYQGAYEDDGTVVYGTGWDYEPWSGDDYYGWGWTWGYCYAYVPWYQWWVWRPWWNAPYGLRSAVIENVYDRWQGRNGLSHYDRAAGATPTPRAPRTSYGGYPALYGRFKSSSGSAAMSPPANTLALNPYTRPQSSVRPGQVPHGAQLLSTLAKAPGAGRDLYASPDGGVYRRQDNGWYRQQAGGKWSFVAPTQGQVDRNQVASARGGQPAGAAGTRLTPGSAGSSTRGQALANRVPNAGSEAQAQQVAALEREYYARSLSQARVQNYRASGNYSRPSRRGGGRR